MQLVASHGTFAHIATQQALRAAVITLCAISTPQRVEDVEYDKSTGTWTLTMPKGVGSIANNNKEDIAKLSGASGGLPLLPTGGQVLLDTQEIGGVGGKIWRSAGALCRWQLTMQNEIRGSRVLELGSGTGASGLFSSGLGASHVVLTDGQVDLVPLLQRNAEQNCGLYQSHGGVVLTAGWLFGEAAPACVEETSFDWIIGSDITYAVSYALEDDGEPEDRHALCRTLRLLLQQHGQARCVIAHEHRRADMFDVETILANEPCSRWDDKDNCLGIFLDSARQHGLVVTPMVLERGARRQMAENLVQFTTDLSVFEVSLVL